MENRVNSKLVILLGLLEYYFLGKIFGYRYCSKYLGFLLFVVF